jgi:hypothetical protein
VSPEELERIQDLQDMATAAERLEKRKAVNLARLLRWSAENRSNTELPSSDGQQLEEK